VAPLPAGAQFLNVIEAVFSGFARAVIHNSNYQSIEEAKHAIDRYFNDRNNYFRENPKRAGRKIWGKPGVSFQFSESLNYTDISQVTRFPWRCYPNCTLAGKVFRLSLPDSLIFVGWRCPEAHSANLVVIQAYLSRTFHTTVDPLGLRRNGSSS
jgi:hypothetical protein